LSAHPAGSHEPLRQQPRLAARRRRWAIRFGFLLAAWIALLPEWFGDLARLAVPSTSLYTGGVSTVATRALRVAALFALPVLLIVLVRRRWFCRYACPTGLLADLAGRSRRRRIAGVSRVPPVGQWLILLSFGGAASPILRSAASRCCAVRCWG